MNVNEVIDYLKELCEDSLMPKNVKEKLRNIISILSQKGDLSLNSSKSLQILEELSDDPNLQPFLRTQLYQVSSLLESL